MGVNGIMGRKSKGGGTLMRFHRCEGESPGEEGPEATQGLHLNSATLARTRAEPQERHRHETKPEGVGEVKRREGEKP